MTKQFLTAARRFLSCNKNCFLTARKESRVKKKNCGQKDRFVTMKKTFSWHHEKIKSVGMGMGLSIPY